MNIYDQIIDQKRQSELNELKNHLDASKARAAQVEAQLISAQLKLEKESMPEMELAATSLRNAGIDSAVTIGRYKQEHSIAAVILLSLRASSSGKLLGEIRITSTPESNQYSATMLNPGSEANLGSCIETDDLREFTRQSLIRFLPTIPIIL